MDNKAFVHSLKNVDILFLVSKYPLICTIYFSPTLPLCSLLCMWWGGIQTQEDTHVCWGMNSGSFQYWLHVSIYHVTPVAIASRCIRLKIQCSRNRNSWLCILTLLGICSGIREFHRGSLCQQVTVVWVPLLTSLLKTQIFLPSGGVWFRIERIG